MMEAKVPLVIVQFQQDYFCNPTKYPNWYGRIFAAVSADRAAPSFFFLNLPGDHDKAEDLAVHARYEAHGPELSVVWQSFWSAL